MFRRSVEWFLGSVVVYILTAACAATGGMDDLVDMATGGLAAMVGGNQGSGAEGSDGQGAESSGAQASDGTGADNSDGEGATGGTSILDPVPDADAAEDGTRIVNLYRTTADGLKTAEGYFDKDLEISCSFVPAGEGKTRCLPIYFSVSASYFADAGCTTRLGTSTKGVCVTSNYVTLSFTETGSCEGLQEYYRYEVYEIGPKVTPTAIYTGTPEACTELTPSDTNDYFSLTKVDLATFAEGTLVQGDQ